MANEINIDDLTLGQVKELQALLNKQTPLAKDDSHYHPYTIGKNYFVRTVTYHTVGRLVAVYKDELVFAKASWVADSGRWNEALKTGELNEVEPFVDNVIVSRAAIVDVTQWNHALPTEAK